LWNEAKLAGLRTTAIPRYAAAECEVTGNRPEECRFSRAVRSDQGRDLAARNACGHRLDDRRLSAPNSNGFQD
jgi:hypothetical protein